MIKRLIFDIDNTLLDTNKDCIDAYKKYFIDRGIDLDGSVLYSIMDIYEEQNKIYSMDKDKENSNYKFNFNILDISKFIKNNLSIEFDVDDFKKLQELYSKYATLKDDMISEVLDKLSKDYDIVALTKWYIEPQKNRLNNAGILKYFNEIYGFENAGIKPSIKTFLTATGNYNVDECVVIGDSISNDIIIPKELGIKTIYVNYNKKETDELSVNNFGEIIDALDSLKKGR